MREMLANLIVIALSGGILWHFYLIAIHGAIIIYEPNTLIWSFEVVMFLGVIAFAIFNIIKLVRRG
ncbi:hypothetical protein ES703_100822 [subsurface metagenome]